MQIPSRFRALRLDSQDLMIYKVVEASAMSFGVFCFETPQHFNTTTILHLVQTSHRGYFLLANFQKLNFVKSENLPAMFSNLLSNSRNSSLACSICSFTPSNLTEKR